MRRNRCEIHISTVTVEGQEVRTFGLVVEGPEGRVTVADISTNEAEVAALCARLNRADLSPLHLRDVVEDWCREKGIG